MLSEPETLRDRLVDLRDDALRQLTGALPVIDLGLLRLVSDITAVLAVLDESATASRRREVLTGR